MKEKDFYDNLSKKSDYFQAEGFISEEAHQSLKAYQESLRFFDEMSQSSLNSGNDTEKGLAVLIGASMVVQNTLNDFLVKTLLERIDRLEKKIEELHSEK